MIITLKGADFSTSNIGTLSTYSIRFDSNGITNTNTSVNRENNDGYQTTIVLKDGYTLNGDITVTMGGVDITNEAVNGHTITIAKVTGNVVIKVPTKSTVVEPEVPEEPDEPETPVDPPSGGETDITSLFDFTMYPTKVCNVTTTGVSPRQQSSSFFDSAVADVSAYAGKTIKIMIPKYTASNGGSSYNATYLTSSATVVDSASPGVFTTMLKLWDTSGGGAKTGILAEYTIDLPSDAQYLYTSIFNDAAISQGIGNTGFYCKVVN